MMCHNPNNLLSGFGHDQVLVRLFVAQTKHTLFKLFIYYAYAM